MKPTCKNITTYVNERLNSPPPFDNISIYLPGLNKNTLNALRANFKVVKPGFMGYIHFEK